MSDPKPKEQRKQKRTKSRSFAFAMLGLIAIFLVFAIVLRWKYNGEGLANTVRKSLQGSIRGRVEVGSINWPLSGVTKLVTGGWLPVTITDLKVYDENNNLVIETPKGTLEIDVHAALAGNYYKLRNVTLADGGVATIRWIKEPYQSLEYDTEVVSLLSAFYPQRAPSFSLGYSAGRTPSVDLRDFKVSGQGITLNIIDSKYQIKIENLKGGGFLFHGGQDPLGSKLYYSLATNDGPQTVAKQATIEVFSDKKKESAYQVKLQDVRVQVLSQLPSRWPKELIPRDIQYKISAKGAGGSNVTVEGAVLDSWIDIFGGSLELKVEVNNAGPLLHSLSEGFIDGKNAKLGLSINGPINVPRLKANIQDIDVHISMGEECEPNSLPCKKRPKTLGLHVKSATPTWDLATDSGDIKNAVLIGAEGQIALSGDFSINPLSIGIRVDIQKPLQLAPYLPNDFSLYTGGTQLSGKLAANGDLDIQNLTQIDLYLGATSISGQLYREKSGKIEASNLRIQRGKSSIYKIKGSFDPAIKNLKNIEFQLHSKDLKKWLRLFKQPLFAKELSGSIQVEGSLDKPIVIAKDFTFKGVTLLQQLSMDLQYKKERISIENAQATSMGGQLSGTGSLHLGSPATLQDIDITISQLNLSMLPIIGPFLEGRVNLTVKGEGDINSPELMVQAKLQNWKFAEDPFKDTTLSFKTYKDGRKKLNANFFRENGGQLTVEGSLYKDAKILGNLSLRALPLSNIIAQYSLLPMGGQLAADLVLKGSIDKPTIEGNLNIVGSWFQNNFLGNADIQIEKRSDTQIRIFGDLFQKRISLDIVLNTVAPYEMTIDLTFRRLELDRFAPALSKKYGIRTWLSGKIHHSGSLLNPKNNVSTAHFDEIEMMMDNDDESGRPAPIRLHNQTDIDFRYAGDQLKLVHVAKFNSPAGTISISGSATTKNLNIHLAGQVSVELLRPYMQNWADEIGGRINISADITGRPDNPQVIGDAVFNKVHGTPLGQDVRMSIPQGKLEFRDSQITFTGMNLLVFDKNSKKTSKLTLSGGVRTNGFTPAVWAVQLDGELSGSTLLTLAPEVFSAASGTALLSVILFGAGSTPLIDGTLEFAEETPFSLTPRAVRRELTFTQGSLYFSNEEIEMEDLEGIIDGEGKITKLNGSISMSQWKVTDFDVRVWARDLSFRVPHTLELSVHLNEFNIVGDLERLEINGVVEIADGKYTQHFNPLLSALTPTRSIRTESSIFEELPLLGNSDLDLKIIVRTFSVENNIANIELTGGLTIKGTPLSPGIGGLIHVEHGSFKFPYSRARFGRTKGSVSFSPDRVFPEKNPILDIQSESDYTGSDGQSHLVQLHLGGPIYKLDADLRTAAGLNKIQTIALILFGRTPDDVREDIGDQSISRKTEDFSNQTTSEKEGSLHVADQFVKDVTGDYFNLIVGDYLRDVSGLDVARLEVQTSAIGLHGEESITESLRLIGEIERSLNGWNWNIQSKYRLSDETDLEIGYLQRYYDDEAEEDKKFLRFQSSWKRYVIP